MLNDVWKEKDNNINTINNNNNMKNDDNNNNIKNDDNNKYSINYHYYTTTTTFLKVLIYSYPNPIVSSPLFITPLTPFISLQPP